MTISIIACISSNAKLGNNGDLLFTIKEDMQHYKKATSGNIVVFGRKTFENIIERNGRALPGRLNVILTGNDSYEPQHGEEVYHSIDKIINYHKTFTENDKKVMICGGERLYIEFLFHADEVILTHVNRHVEEADTEYPMALQDSLNFVPVETSEEFWSDKYDCYYKFVRYTKKPELDLTL